MNKMTIIKDPCMRYDFCIELHSQYLLYRNGWTRYICSPSKDLRLSDMGFHAI